MNEYTDTPIGTNLTVPFRVASVYDVDSNISIVDWTTNVVSDFPWMAFLKEDSEMALGSSSHIVGINTNDVEYHIPIVVSDALGFYMIEESAQLVYRNEALFHEWNKLPVDLDWLYGDKPYMTSVDIAPIVTDLHNAIETGQASSTLFTYIESHSYRAPRSVTAYGSYGLYFENDMVVPQGKSSTVNLKLGVEQFPNKQDVEFTQVGNTITLVDNISNVVEIIVQQRIGDYVAGQSIYIISDGPIGEINLSTDTLIGMAESNVIDDKKDFRAEISIIYNKTTQFPVWAETDKITCTRHAGVSLLTSNEGVVSRPAVALRTPSSVVISGADIGPLSTSVFLLDDKILQLGPVVDSVLYTEYEIIAL